MKFGIIGCGMIARFHAAAIRDMPDSELVACFNRTMPAAEKLAQEFDCTAYDELDAMLAHEGLDIVTICTPSGAHMEPSLAAAAAGKHVLVEKPLDVTVERCDRMIAACQSAGVQLGTIFPSRFHKSSQLFSTAIAAGRFGDISFGDAYVKWYRSQEYYDSGAWRGTWQFDGGGALMNQAIHSVDLLLWLMGPVVQVQAMSALRAHERIEVEDTVVANLKFASGALGVIQATTAAYPGALKRIEISGSTGSVVLEEEDLVTWQFLDEDPADEEIRTSMAGQNTTGGGAADPAAIGHQAHQKLFEDFTASIAEDRKPAVDGDEGRRSVELILAIYASAKSGQPVRLNAQLT